MRQYARVNLNISTFFVKQNAYNLFATDKDILNLKHLQVLHPILRQKCGIFTLTKVLDEGRFIG